MSRLTIADLNQADALTSPQMGQVTGGMSCGTQVDVANGLWDLRDSFNNLGLSGAADAVDGQAHDVLMQPCTV